MKAVLISIHPRWCEKIANGKKTVEIRKTAPKIPTPFKCYIYETKDRRFENIAVCWNDGTPDFIHATGKVLGEFICDRIYNIFPWGAGLGVTNEKDELIPAKTFCDMTCLTEEKICAYIGVEHGEGYGWHISNLKIYDKPRELSEFRKPCDRFLDCFLCRRYKRDEFGGCDSKIRRPPQSYMYVEEI